MDSTVLSNQWFQHGIIDVRNPIFGITFGLTIPFPVFNIEINYSIYIIYSLCLRQEQINV